MDNVVLDTCVLVDFFLVYLKLDKKQEIPSNLKKCNELLKKYESSKFVNIMSKWNKWELRQVLMNLRKEQKFIEAGFSTREFGDARKLIELTEEELKLVNQAVFDLWKFSQRKTKGMTQEDYKTIEKITKKGYEFMDIIHILQAKKYNCDFFVTKDNKLKKLNLLSEEFKIKIIGVKEFLSKLG